MSSSDTSPLTRTRRPLARRPCVFRARACRSRQGVFLSRWGLLGSSSAARQDIFRVGACWSGRRVLPAALRRASFAGGAAGNAGIVGADARRRRRPNRHPRRQPSRPRQRQRAERADLRLDRRRRRLFADASLGLEARRHSVAGYRRHQHGASRRQQLRHR